MSLLDLQASLGKLVEMMGFTLSGYFPAGLSRRQLLALLLVGALLLCHGVFGASHLCPTLQSSAEQSHEHPVPTEMGMVAHDGHPTCHPMGAAEYFAVLLTAFLGLLLNRARLWSRVTAPLVFGRPFYPPIFHPPQRPTTPLIQVFRL
jgi:hypothetical protein